MQSEGIPSQQDPALNAVCISCIIMFAFVAVHGQVTVAVLPEILWGNASSGAVGVHNILRGSVIQVFCTGTDTSGPPDVVWIKNNVVLSNDPPQVRIRTSDDGDTRTSSMLTIENFDSADDGTYKCSVTGTSGSNASSNLKLTSMFNSVHSADTMYVYLLEGRENQTTPKKLMYLVH